MIRGALILAVGFGLGYSKALYDTEEVKEAARQARALIDLLIEEQAKTENKPKTDDFVDVPDSAIEDDEIAKARDNINSTEGDNL